MASQLGNHFSQKNHNAHLDRSLVVALKKTNNFDCQSTVCTSNPPFDVSEMAYVNTIILMKQSEYDIDQKISDEDSGHHRKGMLSSDIEQNNLDHP